MTTATPTAETPVTNHPELTAHDRCDSCKAQAYIRWAKNAMDLLTCVHHGNKFEASLVSQGFSNVQDNRHLINDKPSPSANV